MEPKVSVIIPVYNVEKYLKECVDSVINQTYKNIEIILVDDGSTDASADICDEYARNHDYIKTVHKKNGGLSSARNRGVTEAAGVYVCFLDSDDYWENRSFLFDIIDKVTDEEVILFRFKKYIEKTGKLIESVPQSKKTVPTDKCELLDYLITNGQFISSAWSKMVRKDLLINNNIIFREGVTSEDIEWSGKIILYAESFIYTDISGYVYRQRAESITSTMTRQNIIDLKRNLKYSIRNAKAKLHRSDPLYSVYMAYVAYQFSTLLLCAHNVNENMYTEISDMRKYADVMQYSHNKKVRIFNLIRKIIGFHGLYNVAGLYMKYLYNRI